MAYERTKVSVEDSRSAIRGLLKRHGAEAFQFGEAQRNGTLWAMIEFSRRGARIRLTVPHKEEGEQEERRIWRVIFHNLKARMEAFEEGVETFESAFLGYMVNPATNRTIYEELAEVGRVELPEGSRLALAEAADG